MTCTRRALYVSIKLGLYKCLVVGFWYVVNSISKKTSIMAEDIVFTLNQLGILKIINGVYFIAAEEGLLQTLAKKYPVKNPRVDPSKLHWTAFVTDVKRDKFSIHSKKPDDSLQTKGHA